MTNRTLSLHYALKSLILFGFALYIAYLIQTGRMTLYIAPRMADYVKWSGIALFAAAFYQAYLLFAALRGRTTDDSENGHDHHGDHNHTPSRSLFKNAAIYGLFFLPLVLGFLLQDASMGSSLAAKKGMNLTSADSLKKDIHAEGTLFPSKDASDRLFPADKSAQPYANLAKQLYLSEIITVKEDLYMETLTAVDLYLDRFIGKKMQLTGFVYKQNEMKENQFVIGRFSIQCCSADGSPFGVMAEYEQAKRLPADSWVTATGTIQKTKFNGMDIMTLNIEKLEKAEPAKSPYVYPNPQF